MSDYDHLSGLCGGYDTGRNPGYNPSYRITGNLREESRTEGLTPSGLASKIAGVSLQQLQELCSIVLEDTKRENHQVTGTQQ